MDSTVIWTQSGMEKHGMGMQKHGMHNHEDEFPWSEFLVCCCGAKTHLASPDQPQVPTTKQVVRKLKSKQSKSNEKQPAGSKTVLMRIEFYKKMSVLP